MNAYFLDSSALVKRYVTETGSAWVSGLIDSLSGNAIFIARITGVEVVAAITRRNRAGQISSADMTASLMRFRRELLHLYRSIEITPMLISHAMTLAETRALRGYDAIQLAAALEIYNERLALGMSTPTLISADAALNEAAIIEGLKVDDPNNY